MKSIRSQKTLFFLTILVVVWLGWHSAGQTAFIYGNELKIKFALLSIAYVSIVSALASFLLGGLIRLLGWNKQGRNPFVLIFAVCAVLLFTNSGPGREIGPRYVLPPLLVKYEWVYHTLPLRYVDELQAGPEYGFRKVRWDMSPEQVQGIEPAEPEKKTEYPDGKTETLVYADVNCLGFEADLRYLFEQDKLVAAAYVLPPRSNQVDFMHKLEEIYGEYAFRFKLDNVDRYFWDVGGSEIYLDLPSSAKNKQAPTLNFISKQYSEFFTHLQ